MPNNQTRLDTLNLTSGEMNEAGVAVGLQFRDEVKDALAYLKASKPEAAANCLRVAFDLNPKRWELARIANMISPCGMVKEAQDALERTELQVACNK